MWLGAPQTTPGRRGAETRWYFRNPRRKGPLVKMPWAGGGCSGGGPGAWQGGASGGPLSVLRPPPAPRWCWVLVCRRPGHHLPWLGAGQGSWGMGRGAGWLCREQRHSHEGKGLWGQRGTQERRRQICRRAFLPWVPGECKLQGSNYTKSRNPLLDP